MSDAQTTAEWLRGEIGIAEQARRGAEAQGLLVTSKRFKARLAHLRHALAAVEAMASLERIANGYPVEVDAFTGLVRRDGTREPNDDAVFLTQHDVGDGEVGCDKCKVVVGKAVRIGQGRTLIEAIQNANAKRPTPAERRTTMGTWTEVRWGEWVYADADGKILGGTRLSSRWFLAYLTGAPTGTTLGEYLTERQAKLAVERAVAAAFPSRGQQAGGA